jgi:hypothetical protein
MTRGPTFRRNHRPLGGTWTLLYGRRREGFAMHSMLLLLALVFVFFEIIITAASSRSRRNRSLSVLWKGGAPYCPHCQRQVSSRRDTCRTCGYVYVSYIPPDIVPMRTGRDRTSQTVTDRARIENQISDAAEREQLAADREQRRLERKERRLEHYRSLGIEPGPLAWWRELPLTVRCVILGLASGVPFVAALIWLMRTR